jgi:phosphonopyruvate decarboxylase
MLTTEPFGSALRSRGFNLFTGVPCSFLKPFINDALNHADFIHVANEGEAVAVAAGAGLGGLRPVVLFQNSGLTNAMSPLASLVHPYKLPMLGLVTLRGEPGIPDAPQHTLMGAITTRLLDLLGIAWTVLAQDETTAITQLDEATAHLEAGRPFFFVVRDKTFSPVALTARVVPPGPRATSTGQAPTGPIMDRKEVLELILHLAPQALLISTTGHTSRDLASLADRENHFYMTGSMGCASSIALGLAHARPDRTVIVVDGDGAALMRLGALPALGQRRPPNLLHLILDNGCHESTGGQATLSATVDFPALAAASGYPHARHVVSRDDFRDHLTNWLQAPARQLTLLAVKTAPASSAVSARPDRVPADVARQFREAACR